MCLLTGVEELLAEVTELLPEAVVGISVSTIGFAGTEATDFFDLDDLESIDSILSSILTDVVGTFGEVVAEVFSLECTFDLVVEDLTRSTGNFSSRDSFTSSKGALFFTIGLMVL